MIMQMRRSVTVFLVILMAAPASARDRRRCVYCWSPVQQGTAYEGAVPLDASAREPAVLLMAVDSNGISALKRAKTLEDYIEALRSDTKGSLLPAQLEIVIIASKIAPVTIFV